MHAFSHLQNEFNVHYTMYGDEALALRMQLQQLGMPVEEQNALCADLMADELAVVKCSQEMEREMKQLRESERRIDLLKGQDALSSGRLKRDEEYAKTVAREQVGVTGPSSIAKRKREINPAESTTTTTSSPRRRQIVGFQLHCAMTRNSLSASSSSSSPSPSSSSSSSSSYPSSQTTSTSTTTTSSSARASNAVVETDTHDCSICLETVATSFTLSLSSCRHRFCQQCLRSYIISRVEGDRGPSAYPVPCPDPTCESQMTFEEGLSMVAGCGEACMRYQQLQVRHTFLPSKKYCPNEKCGGVFEFEPGPVGSLTANQVTCPECTRDVCMACESFWHDGFTCAAYQSLPQEARKNPHEAALQLLADKNQWTSCPGCKEMVDKRVDDCNFVQCRCGTGFCYACGVQYQSLRRTAGNLHGKPGCSCGLFNFNEEAPQPQQPQQPQQQQRQQQLQQQQDDQYYLEEARQEAQEEQEQQRRQQQQEQDFRQQLLQQQQEDDLQVAQHLNQARDNRLMNQSLDLQGVLRKAQQRRLNVPNGILYAIRNCQCVYCHAEFESISVLEDHLNYAPHPVYRCCERIFISEQARQQHQSNAKAHGN
eukprot:TRINITY_DN1017_c4_g1_i1.p1 TRINITY_DN1017_c4_g1~~TRINITY_DN1017_c4_g1_i1.p1  ORF type:complete len:596 (-),score=122.99 TRINITY_DN1017_c4_g1_i1:84-1871(-)